MKIGHQDEGIDEKIRCKHQSCYCEKSMDDTEACLYKCMRRRESVEQQVDRIRLENEMGDSNPVENTPSKGSEAV